MNHNPMTAVQKNAMVRELTTLKNALVGSGSKRSLAAVIKKVFNDDITSVQGTIDVLTAAYDRINILQDRDAVRRWLADMPVAATPVKNTVRNVKGVGKVAVVTSEPVKKTRQKATKTVSVPTLNADTEHGYTTITRVLKAAGIDAKDSTDYAGTKLVFNFEDGNGDVWSYSVVSPQFNANGPDDGWAIDYYRNVPDQGADDVGYADGPFASATDVLNWLSADLGVTLKPVADKLRQGAAAHKAAQVGSIQGFGTLAALVEASRVSLQTARDLAQQMGGQDREVLMLIQTIIDSQVQLKSLLSK